MKVMVGKEIVPIGHDLVMQGGKMDENGDLPTEKHDTLWMASILLSLPRPQLPQQFHGLRTGSWTVMGRVAK